MKYEQKGNLFRRAAEQWKDEPEDNTDHNGPMTTDKGHIL
jgi:hypothetical protein